MLGRVICGHRRFVGAWLRQTTGEGSRQRNFDCVLGDIVKIETFVDELRERLQLEARAQSDAIAGLPKQDATTLTPAENSGIVAAEEVARNEIQIAGRSRDEARKELNNCGSARAEVALAVSVIKGETPPPVLGNMAALKQECASERAAYAAFKANHKLERNAAGDDRLVQVVWAAVVVVLESIANAYFYMPISDLGLLGGFFTALFVSVANVACAFLGGALGLRYLSHIEPAKKFAGLVALLVCICICALVVALSALFRGHADAMSTKELDTAMLTATAWKAAVHSLINLDVLGLLLSLNSFLLTFVGVLCAVIGFWKGWEFDDPYPGFGAAHRRKEKAQEAYDDARIEEDERQREWQQNHQKKLRKESDKLVRSKAKMEAACAGFREVIDSTQNLASDTAKLAKALLSVYRQKNSEIRAANPPAYFEDYPTNFSYLDKDLKRIAKDLPTFQKEMQQLIDKCNTEQNNIETAIDLTPNGAA